MSKYWQKKYCLLIFCQIHIFHKIISDKHRDCKDFHTPKADLGPGANLCDLFNASSSFLQLYNEGFVDLKRKSLS